jgi:hypothetical protein
LHLDVEPTLLAIAQRNGPGFLPGTLIYFDKPTADTHRGRMAGVTGAGPGRSRPGRHGLMQEDLEAAIAGMGNDSG